MKTQNFGYKKLYIDGQLVDAAKGKKINVVCPATGEVIAEVAKAGKEDAEKALISAQKGFKYWSKFCLLYTSPSPRDNLPSRMPSSA